MPATADEILGLRMAYQGTTIWHVRETDGRNWSVMTWQGSGTLSKWNQPGSMICCRTGSEDVHRTPLLCCRGKLSTPSCTASERFITPSQRSCLRWALPLWQSWQWGSFLAQRHLRSGRRLQMCLQQNVSFSMPWVPLKGGGCGGGVIVLQLQGFH